MERPALINSVQHAMQEKSIAYPVPGDDGGRGAGQVHQGLRHSCARLGWQLDDAGCLASGLGALTAAGLVLKHSSLRRLLHRRTHDEIQLFCNTPCFFDETARPFARYTPCYKELFTCGCSMSVGAMPISEGVMTKLSLPSFPRCETRDVSCNSRAIQQRLRAGVRTVQERLQHQKHTCSPMELNLSLVRPSLSACRRQALPAAETSAAVRASRGCRPWGAMVDTKVFCGRLITPISEFRVLFALMAAMIA